MSLAILLKNDKELIYKDLPLDYLFDYKGYIFEPQGDKFKFIKWIII